MSRILIVDDELSMRELLEIYFRKAGHEVDTASDGEAGVQRLLEEDYDLVITDLRMPKTHGMVVLERCRELHPDTPIIVMTAYASTQTAIEAMKMGAYDYFTKPFKLDEVDAVIGKALEKRRLVIENRSLRRELTDRHRFEDIIGKSPAMRRVFELVERVAPTRTNVLIEGESGTGKELVARAIHRRSDRRNGPFMVINCAAIPENLLESELFGHKRGSFTGAMTDKPGLFQGATGGTLFLDEIGELPVSMQVKLLRVLQERKVKAVGDLREVEVDVRVIAATNRRLEDEVRAGRFREDLYFRLNVICIELPSLRERPGDVPLLAGYFLRKYSAELGKRVDGIDAEAMQLLLRHPFPGNVRELENVIERAVALAEGDRVTAAILPASLHRRESAAPAAGTPPSLPEGGLDLEAVVDDFERRLISQALARTGGLKKEAARLLGMSFRQLRYRLEKLNIDGPDRER
jgi:two-component system response regulator PilR (NtrC family)